MNQAEFEVFESRVLYEFNLCLMTRGSTSKKWRHSKKKSLPLSELENQLLAIGGRTRDKYLKNHGNYPVS